MTQGTKGSTKARTARKPLKKTDLPVRVPLIHGETTASYLARTAAANSLEPVRLLKALHQGRLPSGAFAPVHPHLQEARLSPKAVTRLATDLSRRPRRRRTPPRSLSIGQRQRIRWSAVSPTPRLGCVRGALGDQRREPVTGGGK
jgi:hypothetical protein